MSIIFQIFVEGLIFEQQILILKTVILFVFLEKIFTFEEFLF